MPTPFKIKNPIKIIILQNIFHLLNKSLQIINAFNLTAIQDAPFGNNQRNTKQRHFLTSTVTEMNVYKTL